MFEINIFNLSGSSPWIQQRRTGLPRADGGYRILSGQSANREKIVNKINKTYRMLANPNDDCSKCCGRNENTWWYAKCKENYCSKQTINCKDETDDWQ